MCIVVKFKIAFRSILQVTVGRRGISYFVGIAQVEDHQFQNHRMTNGHEETETVQIIKELIYVYVVCVFHGF
jgi:hypothetical protein